ncbi:MAG: T9SS type A sorting domain-containing protein [Kaistella sp.]|nr:T9SS type A sorting domain-containing protein [Kaistella sp.]
MKKIYILLFITIGSNLIAQTFNWEKVFGGTLTEEFTKSVETADGNIVFAGNTESSDGDFTINNGLYDVFVAKIDEQGNYLWKKNFGGNNLDSSIHLIKSNEGGVILVTRSNSTGGFFSGNLGDYDLWITKIDTNGDTVWNKKFAGSGSENSSGIFSTANGYIFTVNTNSTDNDFAHSGVTQKNVWLLHINENGTVVWKKRLLGSLDEEATSIKTFDSSSFVLLVNSSSTDGDFTENTFAGVSKGFLYKFNNDGIQLLKTIVDSSNSGNFNSLNNVMFYNNDYVVSGIESFPLLFGNIIYVNYDALFARISSSGSLLWKTNYEFSNNTPQNEKTVFSAVTSDNQLAFFGETSYFPDVEGWVIKMNGSGNIIHTKLMEGYLKDFNILPSGDFLFNLCSYTGGHGPDGPFTFSLGFIHSLVTNVNLVQTLRSGDFVASNNSSSIIKNGKIISFWQSRRFSTSPTNSTDIWMSSYTIPQYQILDLDEINSTEKLSVYPNPVHNSLHLSEKVDHAIILDHSGRRIIEVRNTDAIDMNNLLPGNYLLKAELEGKFQTFKIIKK